MTIVLFWNLYLEPSLEINCCNFPSLRFSLHGSFVIAHALVVAQWSCAQKFGYLCFKSGVIHLNCLILYDSFEYLVTLIAFLSLFFVLSGGLIPLS